MLHRRGRRERGEIPRSAISLSSRTPILRRIPLLLDEFQFWEQTGSNSVEGNQCGS